jgi:hypothetical protein
MNATIEQFVTELRKNPDVLGILLFGSRARGNNREDSDVDLLVIVKHGFHRIVEERANLAFEIIFTTEDQAISFWRANPDDTAELWKTARILFDRNGTMQRLQNVGAEILSQGKAPLPAEQLAHIRFDIGDQVKAIEAFAYSDPVTARLLLSAKMLYLTELYFDIRQLWTPPPKQRLAVIKEIDSRFYDLIAKYYEAPSLSMQIDAFKSILAIVLEQ